MDLLANIIYPTLLNYIQVIKLHISLSLFPFISVAKIQIEEVNAQVPKANRSFRVISINLPQS